MEKLNLSGLLSRSQEQRQASKAAVVSKSVSGKKYHLHSLRPGLGFFISGKVRVKFKGHYYDTDDKAEVDFALAHYGKLVTQIDEEQRVDSETNKVDQAPAKKTLPNVPAASASVKSVEPDKTVDPAKPVEPVKPVLSAQSTK